MEFGVLGPLEVRDDGRTVALGRGKQRALLAILLLHANEVVSADRLIDDLWGERPPATAATALQVYVSKLRKALGADTIATRPPGYAIQLETDELDLHRFERLLAEGRAALADADPASAAPLLHEALGLWRGQPLADLAYEPFAQAEIVRLDELRLTAHEERIEADLALGRHAELVGEIEALVARHPLRERPRRQLMLALYRSGRQAEALDVYGTGRRAFVEELGIEPSSALQELERAILNQDPALAAPAKADVELPAAPRPFAGERKLVTALFVDLGIGADVDDPERLQELIDRVHAAASTELEAAGAAVERGIADALLAVFGAPTAQEDHGARALGAALGLRERLGELFGDALALRIGVESGEVVIGGDEERPTFAGLPVTSAARLIRQAAPGEIVVGERAAAGGRGSFELAERNGALVLVHSLGIPRARERPEIGRTFVGRERELDLLRDSFERVTAEREPRLVAILGDAGIGKTRLVAALREETADAGTSWLEGRCVSFGRAATYRPLAEILRERFGLHEADPAERVRERLVGREVLGLTLGLDLVDEEIHPREARRRLGDAWIELLTEIAAERPAVVVFEDLQWAEEPLLELVEQLSREARGPLFVIATARPELAERAPAWAGGARNSARVWLDPLPHADAERMLVELGGELPDSLRDLVLGRAEGNPFFLEEALATLVDRGVLRREEGGWHVADDLPDSLQVSDSVHAVLDARMDLLERTEKAALQAAAVAGRTFWDGAVRELVESPEIDFRVLVERDFVRRSESSLEGQREFVFKHALTRDVAYASLPLSRRSELHGRFAQWLERVGGGAEQHAPLLAHQYAEAAELHPELRPRAVTWLRRAADAAIERFEPEAAEAMLEQALELADDDATRVEIYRSLARARSSRFDRDGFREAIERALALEPPAEVRAELLGRLALDAGSRPYMWSEAASPEQVESWIKEALELAPPDSRAMVEALTGRALWLPGSGGAYAEEALALAEGLDDPRLRAHAYEASADVAVAAGRLEEAREWADRALAIAPRISDPDVRSNQYMVAADVYFRLGKLATAASLASEYDLVATPLSAHHRVHAVAMHVLTATLAADWEAVLGHEERAEAAAAANTDTPCQFNWRSLLMCALARFRVGDVDGAQRLEVLAGEAAEVWGPLRPDSALVRLALARGDLEELERLLSAERVPGTWDPDFEPARLDALVALGKGELVEQEAAPLLERGGYAGPFALRALGVVRGDASLVEWAAAKFDELDLGRHAAETRALV